MQLQRVLHAPQSTLGSCNNSCSIVAESSQLNIEFVPKVRKHVFKKQMKQIFNLIIFLFIHLFFNFIHTYNSAYSFIISMVLLL